MNHAVTNTKESRVIQTQPKKVHDISSVCVFSHAVRPSLYSLPATSRDTSHT